MIREKKITIFMNNVIIFKKLQQNSFRFLCNGKNVI